MNRIFMIGLLVLTACASSAPVVPEATSAPIENIPSESPNSVVASARAEPAQVSQLSFTTSALVKEIPVRAGGAVTAGDVLMVLNTPDLEYDVIAAEADYKAKSQAAELQKAEKVLYVDPDTGRKEWYSLPREVYLKAVAEADVAKAQWDTAIANLAQATLNAPFDGTIVDVNVVPGELVQVNQVVMTIADLSHLEIVTTDLSERDISRVKIGQSVNVTIEAMDVTISGKVIRISPRAVTLGGDVVFPVTIALDEQPKGLFWGMSAEVEIATGED